MAAPPIAPAPAVLGAASALQLQHDKLSVAEQQRLLTSIVNEAGHLASLTENTLQLVRLANSTQSLTRDWESMEEIIGSVRARVRERDPARRIRAEVPTGLPLVKADSVLLGQLLENLVDNALKYSDAAVDIQARMEKGKVSVAVKDRGPGLSEAELITVFDTFTRGARAQGIRGAGLGLAVCRAIAQAHGATLIARRRSGGGSSFVLSLPAAELPPGDAP